VHNLTEQQIPNMIYYPVPGHRQKMFETFGGLEYDLPVTDWLTQTGYFFTHTSRIRSGAITVYHRSSA
jgi:hypothetical protein